jgi:hypothetical protein
VTAPGKLAITDAEDPTVLDAVIAVEPWLDLMGPDDAWVVRRRSRFSPTNLCRSHQ